MISSSFNFENAVGFLVSENTGWIRYESPCLNIQPCPNIRSKVIKCIQVCTHTGIALCLTVPVSEHTYTHDTCPMYNHHLAEECPSTLTEVHPVLMFSNIELVAGTCNPLSRSWFSFVTAIGNQSSITAQDLSSAALHNSCAATGGSFSLTQEIPLDTTTPKNSLATCNTAAYIKSATVMSSTARVQSSFQKT